MTSPKKPSTLPPSAPSRRAARIQLATAKTELAIPAARPPSQKGFRKPESGPTESLSHESSTRHARPKRP